MDTDFFLRALLVLLRRFTQRMEYPQSANLTNKPKNQRKEAARADSTSQD